MGWAGGPHSRASGPLQGRASLASTTSQATFPGPPAAGQNGARIARARGHARPQPAPSSTPGRPAEAAHAASGGAGDRVLGRRAVRDRLPAAGGALEAALASRRPPSPPPSPGKPKAKNKKGAKDRTQPDADDTEQRIIESLANPVHRPLTVTQRCDVLGISRSTWYRHTSDPLFKTRARDAYLELVCEDLGAVIDVTVQSALVEGKDGHPDRKLVLAMAGLIDGTGTAGRARETEQPQKRGREMSDAELLLHFEGREHLLPAGVLRRLGKDPDAAKDEARVPPPPEAQDRAQTTRGRAAATS